MNYSHGRRALYYILYLMKKSRIMDWRLTFLSLTRCGISTGKCEKECASVTVVEHVECGCDCGHVDRDTCPRNTHVYDTDTCSCKCANTEEKQQCLDQGRTWSTTNCSCQCPDINPSLACSNGLVWSNVTCTCEPEDVVLRLVEEEEDRTPRSGTTEDKLFTWQHITIIVLLVLIFILIATIFALISKLQTAKRRIKTAKLQVCQFLLQLDFILTLIYL